MQTSNYLPYTVSLDFARARYSISGRHGMKSAKFFKKNAHKRARQAVKEIISGRCECNHRFYATGWDID